MTGTPPLAERLRDVPRYLGAEFKTGPWGVCLDAAEAIEALLSALGMAQPLVCAACCEQRWPAGRERMHLAECRAISAAIVKARGSAMSRRPDIEELEQDNRELRTRVETLFSALEAIHNLSERGSGIERIARQAIAKAKGEPQ